MRTCALCSRPEIFNAPEQGPYGPFTVLWRRGAQQDQQGVVVCRPCFCLNEIPRIIGTLPTAFDVQQIFAVLDVAYALARDLEIGHAAQAIADSWARRESRGSEGSEGPRRREGPSTHSKGGSAEGATRTRSRTPRRGPQVGPWRASGRGRARG